MQLAAIPYLGRCLGDGVWLNPCKSATGRAQGQGAAQGRTVWALQMFGGMARERANELHERYGPQAWLCMELQLQTALDLSQRRPLDSCTEKHHGYRTVLKSGPVPRLVLHGSILGAILYR